MDRHDKALNTTFASAVNTWKELEVLLADLEQQVERDPGIALADIVQVLRRVVDTRFFDVTSKPGSCAKTYGPVLAE